MSGEYIRKEVFDATMQGQGLSFASSLKVIHTRLDAIDKRLDDLKDEIAEARSSIVRGWTIAGVIAAIGAAVAAVVQLYLSAKGVM